MYKDYFMYNIYVLKKCLYSYKETQIKENSRGGIKKKNSVELTR